MATKTERMNCSSDDGDCIRCGECCMVLDLATITDDERDSLGKEFCLTDKRGRHGIKRVRRSWAPWFAEEGVCVFLFPGDGGFSCMARDERPLMCSEFRCTSKRWAPIMDYKVAELKFHAEKDSLDDAQKAERLAKLTELRSKWV